MSKSEYIVWAPGEGRKLGSEPGRELTFKLTGEETGGAFDYFVVGVAPKNAPPLHVHHHQGETIYALKGRYKIRIGDEIFACAEGGFAFLPPNVPHAFVNVTDQPGELIVVFTPGGGHRFFEELGPVTRNGAPDPRTVAQVFIDHDMSILGPPLSAD